MNKTHDFAKASRNSPTNKDNFQARQQHAFKYGAHASLKAPMTKQEMRQAIREAMKNTQSLTNCKK